MILVKIWNGVNVNYWHCCLLWYIIQLYTGITSGRILTGELVHKDFRSSFIRIYLQTVSSRFLLNLLRRNLYVLHPKCRENVSIVGSFGAVNVIKAQYVSIQSLLGLFSLFGSLVQWFMGSMIHRRIDEVAQTYRRNHTDVQTKLHRWFWL